MTLIQPCPLPKGAGLCHYNSMENKGTTMDLILALLGLTVKTMTPKAPEPVQPWESMTPNQRTQFLLSL